MALLLVVSAALMAQDAAQPAAPAPAQEPVQTAPAQAPAADAEGTAGPGLVLNLDGASLRQLIDLLAQRLRINYILDPRVDGTVIIRTYGEIRAVEIRSLLETVLRINGAAMVQVGDIYRIVPAEQSAQLPISPTLNASAQDLPSGEQQILNLLFLKFATAKEVDGLIRPFLGQGAQTTVYEPANLIIMLDNARSMRRTMELISLFDSDVLAKQRVRQFDIRNGKPSDVAKELETILKGIAFSKETSSVNFLPIDRVNLLIAVAPNPGVFEEIAKWIEKIDVKVTVTAGSFNNYVYRVKYGDAFMLSSSIMQLYTGMPMGFGGMGMGMGGMGRVGGMNRLAGGAGGVGGMGSAGAMGAGGMGAMGMGGAGAMGMGGMGAMGMGGAGAMGMGGVGGMTNQGFNLGGMGMGGMGMGGFGGLGMGMGGVGNFLGFGPMLGPTGERIPHVIPNMMDNSLLIQATPQDYDKIQSLLEQIDIPPRQVLIEAKIYEVTLTGAFSMGVQAFLNRVGDNALNPGGGDEGSAARRALSVGSTGAGVALTAGMLAGRSRELLAILTAAEDNRITKVVAAPVV
ncbi:MAG: hypothetical protein MUF01_06180, partial [Bryobacterales bacterium]|nr:hypothetical protein [Bryobacterales bacterium]